MLPARIFLMAAEGATNTAMADRLGIGSQLTAGRWRKRFARAWADGRFGAPRPGAPRTIGDEEISASIRLTLQAVWLNDVEIYTPRTTTRTGSTTSALSSMKASASSGRSTTTPPTLNTAARTPPIRNRPSGF